MSELMKLWLDRNASADVKIDDGHNWASVLRNGGTVAYGTAPSPVSPIRPPTPPEPVPIAASESGLMTREQWQAQAEREASEARAKKRDADEKQLALEIGVLQKLMQGVR